VKVSVVMPAHNEELLLVESVDAVVTGLRARVSPFELLVIENGSTDATRALASDLTARHAEVSTRSLPDADYGAALRAGLEAASGDVVVNFDVDYYDLDFLDRALTTVGPAPAPAIVVGSKRAPGAQDHRSLARRFVTWGFGSLLRVGFRLQVSDTHGMKAMVRDRIIDLARTCRFDRDLFDTELVIRAERAGLDVAEIPVTVDERRPSRTPVVRRMPRSLAGLVRLRVALWREPRSR